MKVVFWLKYRWEQARIPLGYYMWVGIPLLSMFLGILGYPKDWIMLGVSHFIGLFIVVRYHWFIEDLKEAEGK